MAKLIEGENGVVSIEQLIAPAWSYATTHTYDIKMAKWCQDRGLGYGADYLLQTYRLENHDQNSHRWYFKDPEVATLFSIIFS